MDNTVNRPSQSNMQWINVKDKNGNVTRKKNRAYVKSDKMANNKSSNKSAGGKHESYHTGNFVHGGPEYIDMKNATKDKSARTRLASNVEATGLKNDIDDLRLEISDAAEAGEDTSGYGKKMTKLKDRLEYVNSVWEESSKRLNYWHSKEQPSSYSSSRGCGGIRGC